MPDDILSSNTDAVVTCEACGGKEDRGDDDPWLHYVDRYIDGVLSSWFHQSCFHRLSR
jgi:hypothetical protein